MPLCNFHNMGLVYKADEHSLCCSSEEHFRILSRWAFSACTRYVFSLDRHHKVHIPVVSLIIKVYFGSLHMTDMPDVRWSFCVAEKSKFKMDRKLSRVSGNSTIKMDRKLSRVSNSSRKRSLRPSISVNDTYSTYLQSFKFYHLIFMVKFTGTFPRHS